MEGRDEGDPRERQCRHADRRRHRLVHVDDVEPFALEESPDPEDRARAQDDVGKRAVRRDDHRAADGDHVRGRTLVPPAPRVQCVGKPPGRIVADDDPRLDAEPLERAGLVLRVFGDTAPERPGVRDDDPDLHAEGSCPKRAAVKPRCLRWAKKGLLVARRLRGRGGRLLRDSIVLCLRGRVALVDCRARECLFVHVQRVVTRGQVAVAVIDERRLHLRADVGRVPAARMEAAAGRRPDRARHVSFEDDPLPCLRQAWSEIESRAGGGVTSR